ncbi:MAG: hypothetical protein WCP06_05740 [Verrucomicrobiota bacterium]
MSNINLDGAETSVIKTLGVGGGAMTGKELSSRLAGIGDHELFDILKTLCDVGYVNSSRDIGQPQDVGSSTFFVNPGYSKDLKEALNPTEKGPSKRVRRQ